MNKATQHERIKSWFKTNRELTTYQAFAKLHIVSLQKRLSEMRALGIRISRGRWIDARGGKRVKAYWLEGKAA